MIKVIVAIVDLIAYLDKFNLQNNSPSKQKYT